ncbi:MAG: hypothetical protein NTW78_03855 [Campylobacterales bacterium]|nr:hypothetical protein [Campylobacterales bacterium]
MDDNVVTEEKSEKGKRSEWEIQNDVRTIESAFKILKDKQRLEEVQEMIKSNKDAAKSMEILGDGNLKLALGL